jgi:outer membrane receptor protein involved in Fe transport
MRKTQLAAGLSALLVATASAQPLTEIVEVVGQTPLGSGIGVDRVAANVQQVTADEIAAQRLLDLSEYLRRNLGSVFVNEAQSNPLQPDLQYRGFVGSPLLGLPQGLAVYQDGVRLNEPFGDTVNWALVPESAIATTWLMPGSDPLFGLNALGGAISIRTRDGFTSPGTTLGFNGGSFGRLSVNAATGGGSDRFGYFAAGQYLEEDGWRDYSPTRAAQFFGKLSWRTDHTDVDLSVNLADTDLIGNGAAPIELLAVDREAIFTRPDYTGNELGLVNLTLRHALNDRIALSGNAYFRNSDIETLNGDDSDFEACENAPALLCAENGGTETIVIDGSGDPVPALEALTGAAVNRTGTRQDGAGFGIEASIGGDLADREHQLVIGLVYDDSETEFIASTELGRLDATRLAVPGGVFVGESFTELLAETRSLGFYVSSTLPLNERIAVTLAGRYNDTETLLRDQLGTALNGEHAFERFNPSIALTARLVAAATFYARFSEASRVPSPVELTCADEDDPCRLPNAFLADPPLEQVVARSFETGLRGSWGPLSWHAGIFRTTNRDDILFISAGALTSEGYFDNIGQTRRQGIEINTAGEVGRVSWFVNYSFLDATFRQDLLLQSPNNPAAEAGEIRVRPGDRLPLLPRHLLQAGFDFRFSQRFGFGAGLGASSGFHLRGDEGNAGDEIGRHVVVGLRGDYRVSDRLRLFLNIDNIFDRDYESFGLFGEPDEVLGDAFEDSRFLSPAAPRAAWLGLQLDLR